MKPMGRDVYFITHPNVVIDRDIPVPDWPLSALGKARMRQGLSQPWVRHITSVYSSTERKAVDGASILAEHLSLSVEQIPELGENDRSSTGFLPPSEFEAMADAFFAQPEMSARGCERAIDAQSRVVNALARVMAADKTAGAIAIVSHGAVGTLLYCKLSHQAISRCHDQPANGGGNYFHFSAAPPVVYSSWSAIDEADVRPTSSGS